MFALLISVLILTYKCLILDGLGRDSSKVLLKKSSGSWCSYSDRPAGSLDKGVRTRLQETAAVCPTC